MVDGVFFYSDVYGDHRVRHLLPHSVPTRLSSDLRVPEAIALARRARRIVRQNLAWALGYNAIALPLAALGWVTPWLAALGMAASSLLVTFNAQIGRAHV